MSARLGSSYGGFEVLNARPGRMEGYLGRFRVWAEGEGGVAVDLSVMSPRRDGCFDVVLDMREQPIVEDAVHPPGYLFWPQEEVNAPDLADHLVRYRGRFKKPRYVRWTPELCVHQRQGVLGCDRCLDACPAGAIAIEEGAVSITYELCHGCGTCVQRCPSGAVATATPSSAALSAEVKSLLQRYREEGGAEAFVLFHDDRVKQDILSRYLDWESPTVVPVALHSVGQSNLENWFAALAHGAVGVGVLVTTNEDPRLPVLEQQMELADALSGSIGLAAGTVRLLRRDDDDRPRGPSLLTNGRGAVNTLKGARRRRERLGPLLDLLSAKASTVSPVPLRAGAPFGMVELDAGRCTLCGACVNLCPESALQLARQGRALSFTEAACVQCGICANACPERALSMVPRWAPEGIAGHPQILHQADDDGMAHCAVCGRSFMPKAVLAAALSRVGSVESISGANRQLLHYCPACRAEATMREQFISSSPS
jgi:ferredoxin